MNVTEGIVVTAVVSCVGTCCICVSLLYTVLRLHSRPIRIQSVKIRSGVDADSRPPPSTLLELGLSHLERLIERVESRVLARLFFSDVLLDLRRVLLEMRALNESNRLLEAPDLQSPAGGGAADEFASNWFKLGSGQEQYQGKDTRQHVRADDVWPEDSASQQGGGSEVSMAPYGSRATLLQRIPSVSIELLSWIRGSFDEWDFDVAKLRSWSATVGMPPLLAITLAMHTSSAPGSLLQLLGASEASLVSFISRVVGEYRQLPYHSEIHACDVMHAASVMHTRICGPDAPATERIALVLAAIVHDLSHPGVNNSFLVETSSPLAVRYNDSSVLENHHISLAFAIMLGLDRREQSASELDPLAVLDRADYRRVRTDMVALVLATSFEHHFTHIGNLKSRAVAGAAAQAQAQALGGSAPELDEKQRHEERLFLLKMVVKSADIGHPARNWDWHVDSAKRACAEFFHQGECELRAGLPVSPLNNAEACDLSKAQTGFLEFMVRPAFESLRLYVESCPSAVAPGALKWLQQPGGPLQQLEANVQRWKAMDAAASLELKETIRQIEIVEPFKPEWFFHLDEPAASFANGPPAILATHSEGGAGLEPTETSARSSRLRAPFFFVSSLGNASGINRPSRTSGAAVGGAFSLFRNRPPRASEQRGRGAEEHPPPAMAAVPFAIVPSSPPTPAPAPGSRGLLAPLAPPR